MHVKLFYYLESSSFVSPRYFPVRMIWWILTLAFFVHLALGFAFLRNLSGVGLVLYICSALTVWWPCCSTCQDPPQTWCETISVQRMWGCHRHLKWSSWCMSVVVMCHSALWGQTYSDHLFVLTHELTRLFKSILIEGLWMVQVSRPTSFCSALYLRRAALNTGGTAVSLIFLIGLYHVTVGPLKAGGGYPWLLNNISVLTLRSTPTGAIHFTKLANK